MLSIKEIASACQLSEKAVRRAIDDGKLSAVKLRSRLRVTPQDFEAWITSSRRTSSIRAPLDPRPLRARRAPAETFRSLIKDGADSGAEPMSVEKVQRASGDVWRVRWRDAQSRPRSRVARRKRDAQTLDAELKRAKRLGATAPVENSRETLCEFAKVW